MVPNKHRSSLPKAKSFKTLLISSLRSDSTALVDSTIAPTSKVPLTTLSLTTHQMLVTELPSLSAFSNKDPTSFLVGTFALTSANSHQASANSCSSHLNGPLSTPPPTPPPTLPPTLLMPPPQLLHHSGSTLLASTTSVLME